MHMFVGGHRQKCLRERSQADERTGSEMLAHACAVWDLVALASAHHSSAGCSRSSCSAGVCDRCVGCMECRCSQVEVCVALVKAVQVTPKRP